MNLKYTKEERKTNMEELNLHTLEKMMKKMSKRSKLYLLIKKEIESRGNWKPQARGKAFTSNDPRRNDFTKR